VHQFAWHPITVLLGWRRLYGSWPGCRECVCILVHDWGYWGCETMEGDGQRHPEVGARIAGRLFGPAYHDLVLLHSRHYAQTAGREPSALCWPDKLHALYYPTWIYILLGTLSGEIHEYRRMAAEAGFTPLSASHGEWYRWVRAYMAEAAAKRTARYVFHAGGDGGKA
jgi:hypothetical protein